MPPPISAKSLLLAGLLAFAPWAAASVYYVDFAGGNDASSGTSAASPWKHAPGDPNAGGNVAKPLKPGDTVLFKGGVVYRGSIVVPSSGAEGNPILYDGNSVGNFGSGRAIVDGSEAIDEWKKCASPEEAGHVKDWERIYRADLPAEALKSPFAVNLHEGDDLGIPARSPNLRDAYALPDMKEYYLAAKGAPEVGPESADVAPRHGEIPADFADSAWISIWVANNWLAWQKIKAAKGSVVFYDKVVPHRHGGRYALWNHPSLLDQPGEYAVVPAGDRAAILYWPRGEKPSGVFRSVREKGFDFNRQSHVEIRHFLVRRHAGSAIRSTRTDGQRSEGLVVEDCKVVQNHSLAKEAAIQIRGGSGLRVAGNVVAWNVGSPGIGVYGSDHAVIERNRLRRNGGTGIRCFGISDSRILGNTVFEHTGIHSNGISVYVGSSNVLVEGNNVRHGLFPCTIQASNRITLRQNVFDGREGGLGLALYDSPEGQPAPADITVENNTLIAPNGGSLRVDVEIPGLKVIRNLMDGGPDPEKVAGAEKRGNVYTRDADRQKGEPDAKYPDTSEGIYANAAAGDFRIVPGSAADEAGAGCTLPDIAAADKWPVQPDPAKKPGNLSPKAGAN